MNPSFKQADVVIIGAGPVGQALAYGLAEAKRQVILISDVSNDDLLARQSQRYSTLNIASCALLQALGVLGELDRQQALALVRQIEVFDASGQAPLTFDAGSLPEPYLAQVVSHHALLEVLLKRDAPTLQRVCGKASQFIEKTNQQGKYIELTLEDGRFFRSKYLLGADGGQSWLRGQRKDKLNSHYYHQKAVIATVVCGGDHGDKAIQRFLPEGPLAFLPSVVEGYPYGGSLVWSMDNTTFLHRQHLSDQAWVDAASRALNHTLHSSWKVLGKVEHFPLKRYHVPNYHKGQTALLGDAAHGIHPLAGQGLNMGLSDVAILRRVLTDASAPFGHAGLLAHYHQASYGRNQSMMMAMDGFLKAFAPQSSLLSGIRQSGMQGIDRLTCIKREIMKVACGLV